MTFSIDVKYVFDCRYSGTGKVILSPSFGHSSTTIRLQSSFCASVRACISTESTNERYVDITRHLILMTLQQVVSGF